MRLCKAYIFRLKTDMEIEELCFQFAGCNRFVWNKALALQKDSLDKTQKLPWYNDLAGCLVDWKRTEGLSFLKTAPSQTLQQTLKFLDRAWKDAFDPEQPGKKFPVFKKKLHAPIRSDTPRDSSWKAIGCSCLRSDGSDFSKARRSLERPRI